MPDDLSLVSLRQDLVRIDRTQISWRVALRNTVGVALPLAIGAETGHLGAGLAVTIGALNVAFSDRPGSDPAKIERMAISSLIGAVSVFAGSSTGEIYWLHLVMVVVWGFAGGLLMALGPVVGQLGVSGIVLLLVMSAQPKSPPDALELAGLVLLGGIMQTVLAAAFGHWRDVQGELVARYRAEAAETIATLRAQLTPSSSAFRHALRLSLCLALADALVRALDLSHGYWAPLTVAIVLRPDLFSTVSRGAARLVGTGLGLVLATALVHWLLGGTLERIILIGLLAFVVRLLGPANFALSAVPLTSLVVVMLSLIGTPPATTIVDRAVNTVLGGLLALGLFLIWPGPGMVAEQLDSAPDPVQG